jgi:CBS domain containing-hemolysin-like protein
MAEDPAEGSKRRRGRWRKDAPELEDPQQKAISDRLAELSEVLVREVMTPRLDVETLTTPVTAEDVARLVRESGHDCYPVVLEDLDDVVGLLFVKDLFRAGRRNLLEPGSELSTLEITRKFRAPLLLPESMDVLGALAAMQAQHRSVALVVDEHGGVAGILSVKDLLEPLVGEMRDELEAPEEPKVTRVDAERWLVDGQATLDEVAAELGLTLPEGEYVTLGGFLFDALGRIPEAGEEHALEGWSFKIQTMDKRRIDEVLLRRLPEIVEDDLEGDEV